MSDKQHVRGSGEITYTRRVGDAEVTSTGTPAALREAGCLKCCEAIEARPVISNSIVISREASLAEIANALKGLRWFDSCEQIADAKTGQLMTFTINARKSDRTAV